VRDYLLSRQTSGLDAEPSADSGLLGRHQDRHPIPMLCGLSPLIVT